MRKAANRIFASVTVTFLVMLTLFGVGTVAATTASASSRGTAVVKTATGPGAVAGAKIKPIKVHGKWRKHGWAHRMTKPVTKTAAYHLYMHTRHHHHATKVSNKVSKAIMAKATKTMKAAAQPFTSAPSADQSFDGLDSNFNDADPLNFGDNWQPDPSADVSPDYYVQLVDYSMGVFDKNGNLLGAQELEDLFSNNGTTTSGTACDYDVDDSLFQAFNVVYDSQTDRWIVAADEWSDPNFETGPQYECLAVSTSGNPMGSYNLYPIQLVGSGNVEVDAQDVGLWDSGVYLIADRSCDETTIAVPPCPVGTNTNSSGTALSNNDDLEGDLGSQVFAFNTSDLESGAPLRWQTTTGLNNLCTGNMVGKCGTFDAQELYGWLAASDQVQTGLPPSGAPEYFMTQDDNVAVSNSQNYQNFVRWQVNWNNPALSTIAGGDQVTSYSQSGTTLTVNVSVADNYVVGDNLELNMSPTANGLQDTRCLVLTTPTPTQFTCTSSTSQTVGSTSPPNMSVRIVLVPAAPYFYHYDNTIGGDFTEPSPGNPVWGNYNQAIPRLRYVNFGGTEQLWWSETTANSASGSGSVGRASWFRVDINSTTRAVTNGASSYYNPDTTNRFYPSSALDKNGDLLMGYNVSSSSVYPGLRYAGRLAGDAIGAAGASGNTTQTETTLQNGSSYLFGSDPDDGGDFSTNGPVDAFGGNTLMALDPDGCHFWFTGEYLTGTHPSAPDGSDNTWNTRVGEIHYPSCTPSTLNTSLTTSGVSGSPGTLTATLTSVSTSSGVGGKTISFKLDGNPVGTAVTDNYGVATLTGVDTTGDSPGNNPGAVSASFAATGEYTGSNGTGDLNIETDQSITFPSLTGMTIGDGAQGLSATASSGNTVTYTASPGSICAISGGSNVSVAGGAGGPAVGPGDKGTCTVTANQAGDGTYNPAPPVNQTFLVVGQPQTVTITGLWSTTNQAVGVDFVASATASSGLPVGFTTDGVNCDIDGGTLGQNVLPSHTGTCTVNATQIGNDTYAPATTTVGVPVTIQASQTCAIAGTASRRIDQAAPLSTAVTCTPSGLNASSFTVSSSASNVGTIAASTASTIANAPSPINLATTRSDTITTASTSGMGGTTITYTCGACGTNDLVGQTVTAAGITGGTNLNATAVVTAVTSTTVAIAAASSSTTGATYTGATLTRAGIAETAGTTATANTTTAHGFTNGAAINIAGVTPSGYNGPWTVSAAPAGVDTFQFSTAPTAALGNSSAVGTVTPANSGASESGTTVTLTTTTTQTIGVGVNIHVRNVGVAGYNGDYVTEAPTGGTTVTYEDVANTALSPSGGGNVATAATGASENGSTVTLNTTAAHGLAPGASIVITGVGVTGYNGTWTTEAPTSGTTITYEDTNLNLNSSGSGTVASAAVPSCTVGGSPGAETVTALHTGTCTVTATQTGNADYTAAPNVSKTFTFTAGQVTLTVTPANGNEPFVPDFGVTATSSGTALGDTSPIVLASTTPLVCSISGSTVHPLGVGTCTITANQAANLDFGAATQVTRTYTIVQAAQTIAFGPLSDKFTDDADFGVSALATSGLAVAFSSGTLSVCTVTGSTVHIVGITGICTIAANQAGNANYTAAPQVTQSFNVNKHNQTITLTGTWATDPHNFGDPDFAATATASSGDPVSFTAVGACTVTPDGSVVHITGSGACTITAHQVGDANYNAAPDVPASWGSGAEDQTITFNPLPNKTFNDPDFSISATATSTLPVNFTASPGTVCTIVAGPKVHITGGGICTVTAHQPGNINYNPAPDVSRSFTVNPHATTTKLKIKPKKVAPAHSVTFTATVNGGGPQPIGLTVQFKADGVTVIGSAVTNASGVAKLTVNISLSVGTHVIRAITMPNANFSTSTSPAVNLKVT